ncbi:MAG TPA: DNA translocase FtsK 4TM domain-containing protein, partial [Candidatus Eisenbacteria bacterium]
MPSARSSALSAKRQRQILAVLLGAFALLAAASVATFHRPLAGDAPWQSANACGPVGAALAWALAWTFGHAAALLVPVLAGVWAWNRLHDHAAGPLLLKSALAALLVFELCTLFGLSGLDRWTWAGGWGLASSLALQTSLGAVGSWVVGGALLLASALAASELGFHWIGALMHGAVVKPAQGAVAAYGSWQESRAEAQRLGAKQRARDEKE